MRIPHVKCTACDGCGEVPLSTFYALFETYGHLSAEWQTTWNIARLVNTEKRNSESIGQSAVANRLADLHRLGLAERERMGREYIWRRPAAWEET